MNQFVQKTTGSGCTQSTTPDSSSYGPNGIVMDYYDGNTVTGLWNLAQHFSLNDNSYSTQFGPSSPGAINLISGQTNGAEAHGGGIDRDRQRHAVWRRRALLRPVLQQHDRDQRRRQPRRA